MQYLVGVPAIGIGLVALWLSWGMLRECEGPFEVVGGLIMLLCSLAGLLLGVILVGLH